MPPNRQPRKSSPNLTEVGSSGLLQYGGIINEEFLRNLAGVRGVKIYAEMRDNDDTVGAVMFIIDKLLRNVPWKVPPVDQSPAAIECADFTKTCMDDMEHSWGDFISEVMSMLVFGWSGHEIVYKIRAGYDNENPSYHSDYDDQRVGWRKLPLRAQETLYKFVFSDCGDVLAMVQQPPLGQTVTIPIEKLLMFKTQSYKNNPMGRSVLRNAYISWFRKKRIEEFEGVGVERDLNGFPVAWVPPELLASTATPDQKASLSGFKKFVKSVRRDEQEGAVLPLAYDEHGNKLYDFTLMNSGGSRQFDTNQIITRYAKAIAMSVLADFIFLGQSKVGSYALSSDKTDMFSAGLGAWLTSIADVLNKKALPRLMKLNGFPREIWPKFVPGDIEKENVQQFCDCIYKLAGVGALVIDDEVDTRIREILNIPKSTSDITPLSQLEDEIQAAKDQKIQDQKNQEAKNSGFKNMPGQSGKKGGTPTKK